MKAALENLPTNGCTLTKCWGRARLFKLSTKTCSIEPYA
jgi:hypothetical protein